jgi:hypothetical protein
MMTATPSKEPAMSANDINKLIVLVCYGLFAAGAVYLAIAQVVQPHG